MHHLSFSPPCSLPLPSPSDVGAPSCVLFFLFEKICCSILCCWLNFCFLLLAAAFLACLLRLCIACSIGCSLFGIFCWLSEGSYHWEECFRWLCSCLSEGCQVIVVGCSLFSIWVQSNVCSILSCVMCWILIFMICWVMHYFYYLHYFLSMCMCMCINIILHMHISSSIRVMILKLRSFTLPSEPLTILKFHNILW